MLLCISAFVKCECVQIERNKELAVKFEEQTWQQNHTGLGASNLRERLLDSNYGLCRLDLLTLQSC